MRLPLRKWAMVSQRTCSLTICLAVVCALICGVILYSYSTAQSCTNNAAWYREVATDQDPEWRNEQLPKDYQDRFVDKSAFVGMPEAYSEAASRYVEFAFRSISAVAITRQRFFHRFNREMFDVDYGFPSEVDPIYDRDVTVPLVILPRPDAVRRWSSSWRARALGWLPEDAAARNRGTVYGRTLIFQPGTESAEPYSVPASPIGTRIQYPVHFHREQFPRFFLELGKLVEFPRYKFGHEFWNRESEKDPAVALRFGEPDGAKLLGEFVTVPANLKNLRLRWVNIRTESKIRQFLGYSLVDGNGGMRPIKYLMTSDGPVSPYARPLLCDQHQPKIRQHDELLLPTPLPWPPMEKVYSWSLENFSPYHGHEEWCLDDWFPAQTDSCWVIREAKDSRPLQESFLLMPASEESDRPAFVIALFAETEPRQLVTELAALFKVSPDATFNSPEAMSQLNSLYWQVRDFPLDRTRN